MEEEKEQWPDLTMPPTASASHGLGHFHSHSIDQRMSHGQACYQWAEKEAVTFHRKVASNMASSRDVPPLAGIAVNNWEQ